MPAVIFSVIQRDLAVMLRRRSSWFEPLLFFAVVAVLFPLSMTADAQRISEFGTGAVWLGVVLSGFLSLERLFQPDYENGSLEQLLLMPQPPGVILFAKILAHWLVNGVPLAIVASLYAGLLFAPVAAVAAFAAALLIGTIIMMFLGSIGAALTVSARRGSMLTGLLVLPLYLPPLVFGARLSEAALHGLPLSGYFAMLGAILITVLVVAPFCAAAALKVMLE